MQSGKFSFLVLVSIIFIETIEAQPYPTKIWDKRFGGYGWDQTKAPLKISKDGNILCVGEISAYGGNLSAPSKGNADYWIFKVDLQGNLIWEKSIGGTLYDTPREFLELADGGFIIVGDSESGIGGDKTEPHRGGLYDYWVVRLDSTRNVIWDKTLGGSESDRVGSVVALSDGSFLVLGTTYSPQSGDVSGVGFISPTNGGCDMWLVKLDSLGNKLWDKRYGGYFCDRGYGMIQSTDGNFIMTGTTEYGPSFDVTGPTCGGAPDYWLIKIDTLGNKIWDRRYGSNNWDDENYKIKNTADNGFIVMGGSMGPISCEKSEMYRADFDFWLVKCDSMGFKQWDKTLGSDGAESLGDIVQTPDGGYFLAGGCSGTQALFDKSQPNHPGSTRNMWGIKIASTGVKQWDVRWGGNISEGCSGLAYLNDGSYVAFGTSWSNASFDKSQDNWMLTPTITPNADLWLIRFMPAPVSLWEQGDSQSGIDVFPNPFSDKFELGTIFSHPGSVTMRIQDMTGKILIHQSFEMTSGIFNHNLALPNLPSGVYALTLTNGQELRSRKIVKF